MQTGAEENSGSQENKLQGELGGKKMVCPFKGVDALKMADRK